MNLGQAKAHAREVLSNMPEEVFTLWLDGQIQFNGWPPSGEKWDNILRHRDLSVWRQLRWKKEQLRLDKISLTPESATIIQRVSDAMIGRVNEVSDVVSDSAERAQRIISFLAENRSSNYFSVK